MKKVWFLGIQFSKHWTHLIMRGTHVLHADLPEFLYPQPEPVRVRWEVWLGHCSENICDSLFQMTRDTHPQGHCYRSLCLDNVYDAASSSELSARAHRNTGPSAPIPVGPIPPPPHHCPSPLVNLAADDTTVWWLLPAWATCPGWLC